MPLWRKPGICTWGLITARLGPQSRYGLHRCGKRFAIEGPLSCPRNPAARLPREQDLHFALIAKCRAEGKLHTADTGLSPWRTETPGYRLPLQGGIQWPIQKQAIQNRQKAALNPPGCRLLWVNVKNFLSNS